MSESSVVSMSAGTATGETARKQSEVAEGVEISFGGFRFFAPSSALANAIMEENQRLVSEYVERNFPTGYQYRQTESRADDDQQVRMGKRVISERLYHYLSSLAETPMALCGRDFPIWEYLPDGMATMLGLSAYRDMPEESERAKDILRLLVRLTREFQEWLVNEQNGSFVTPWIEMSLTNSESLRLTAIEETTDLGVNEVAIGE